MPDSLPPSQGNNPLAVSDPHGNNPLADLPPLPSYLRPTEPPDPEGTPLQVYLLTMEAAEVRLRMASVAGLLRLAADMLMLPLGDPGAGLDLPGE
jgi:hypothetical protein